MSLVVDASAVIAWLLREDRGADSERVLSDSADALRSPAMLWIEVPYVLGKRLARGEISLRQRDAHLVRTRRLGVEIDLEASVPGAAFDRMIALSDQFRLTVYDAAYLELAIRAGGDLLTFDGPLARAAASAGVGLAYG